MASRFAKLGLTLVLASALPALAGCGFTPLYAEPGVVQGMSGIEVRTPRTRTGHLLREELEDAFAVKRGGRPAYRLTVQIEDRRRARGLNPDDTPTRYEQRLDVTYTLTRLPGGEVVLKQTKPVFVTADASYEPYAGIVAQQDSEARAAGETAEMIRTDVALALRPQ
jgi:LPS-assembly lipoprotein